MTRFAFIDRQKALYDVTVLCRLLKVSRSGFYAWVVRALSARAVADGVLTEQIRTAFDDNRKVYGSPRIHAELVDAGVHVGRKRVARLMKAADIVGCHRRKRSFAISTQNPKAEAAPDLVDRKFVATCPNQLWVADVTYVPTAQGWLYLACVTDVFSRLVLGWSMASHRKTDLVVDAVTMAVHRRGGHVPGVIHHSDRGGRVHLARPRARAAPARGAGQHGVGGGLLRQRAGRKRVRHARVRAVRSAARRPVHQPARGQARRLRLPRDVLQPTPPAQLAGHVPGSVRGRLLRARGRARRGRGVTANPWRDDSVTTSRTCQSCQSCQQPIEQFRGRQRFCSAACRQRAYRNRQPHPDELLATLPSRPPRGVGVYQCPDCDTRYVGQQRCADCNVFCHRIGIGGTCPSCDEPVTIDELLPA